MEPWVRTIAALLAGGRYHAQTNVQSTMSAPETSELRAAGRRRRRRRCCFHTRPASTFRLAQSSISLPHCRAAAVTIFGVCVALVLFVSELRQCMTTRRVQEVRPGPPLRRGTPACPLLFQLAGCLLPYRRGSGHQDQSLPVVSC